MLRFCLFILLVFEVKAEITNDLKCEKQLKSFTKALDSRELWALQLFDFWAKISSGYSVGSTRNFGHYTDCLRFRHQENDDTIQGQHCLITFKGKNSSFERNEEESFDWREVGSLAFKKSLTLVNGVCLPASCSTQKVLKFIDTFLEQADLQALSVSCKNNDPIKLVFLDYFAIVIFSLFIFIVISSTIYDLIIRMKSGEANKLLIAFSVYTNGAILFDVRENKSPRSFNCLHGLRACSVLWIVFGHRVLNHLRFPMANPNDAREHFDQIYSVIYTSYEMAVDTFLIMGALLMTYSTLNAMTKNTLNIPRMILHRYLRYTPPLAALTLFTVSLYKFLFDGPMSGSNFGIIQNCKSYWYSTIFHFQNYMNPTELCLSHTWYLTIDFQLYVVTPFIIYPALKWGWKYMCLVPGLAVLSSVYIIIISLSKEIYATHDMKLYKSLIYHPTHARMGPWFIGVAFGYFLYTNKDKNLSVSKRINSVLWIVALSILATVAVLFQPIFVSEQTGSLILQAMFMAFSRQLWAVALCWIIFACYKLKTGGFIKWFLEHPYWQPIGRMGLSIYILHVVYQKTVINNQKQIIVFELWQMMHEYWGDLFATIVLSAVLYLMFEAPFILVEHYFYEKLSTKSKADVGKAYI